jgi:hypothetical protein
MVVSQDAQISLIRVISSAGFSAISHVQASIPAEMAEGVKTAKGKATI